MVEILRVATSFRTDSTIDNINGLCVTLDYEARFLRRKRLLCDTGEPFLVDLAETVSLNHGDVFICDDGTRIAIRAAAEPVIEIWHENLPMVAWHIGNRHTPCEVLPDHLVIRKDHVLSDLLSKLGAQTIEKDAPFKPLGGAYGYGRTHAHSH
jgi:urease accessory protein